MRKKHSIGRLKKVELCPNCGNDNYDIYKWEEFSFKCCECGFESYYDDLLSEEEWKNKNRTQLIEKMLK